MFVFEPGYEGPESRLRLVFARFSFWYFFDKFMVAPGDTLRRRTDRVCSSKKIIKARGGAWQPDRGKWSQNLAIKDD